MQSKIKNLIFDVGGVLIFIKKIEFSRLDKKFGLPRGTIKRIFKASSKRVVVDKHFDESIFFKQNFSHLLNWHDYHQILKQWLATERLNKWLVGWIKRKRKNYRIILLTNYTAALEWRLEKKFKIAHHFDHVFNSADIGIAKPNPRIFRHLLRNIKAKAGECLFVDNKEKNIETAEKLGFQTILFKNNRQFRERLRKLKI